MRSECGFGWPEFRPILGIETYGDRGRTAAPSDAAVLQQSRLE
jgi:hypothetical protein